MFLLRPYNLIDGRIYSIQCFSSIEKEIFDPLGMDHTSYVWNETYAANGACGHDSYGSVPALRKRTEPNGGASLLTTASDYAAFICAVLNAEGLSQETINQMISPHVQVTKNRNTAFSLSQMKKDASPRL